MDEADELKEVFIQLTRIEVKLDNVIKCNERHEALFEELFNEKNVINTRLTKIESNQKLIVTFFSISEVL